LLNVFGEHPVALLAGAGALLGVAGAAAAYGLSSDGPKRRAKRKSSKKASKGRAYESASGITGSERQYKRKGGGRVKYTKKGQPYVLDKSGKARFIKKSKR
jgi:hypothetical protein